MQYKISWVEKKNNDWIVSTVNDFNGAEFKDVSINRTNKKGEVFPNFDAIMAGHTLEANLWTSSAGKHYLFAPDPKNASTGQNGPSSGGGIAKAQERKAEFIKEAQERKNDSIAYFNALNSAIALVTKLEFKSEGQTKVDIVYWRDWFLSEWKRYDAGDITDKQSPF